MYELLDSVQYPSDIRKFSIAELRQLCAEVRAYMIDCCSKNPGHLASSLGAVELIIGFHYIFNTPQDKIVFDVGHQAYAHKIITGRKEAFKTFRTKDGISGFPKRGESEYDAFSVGHSSTSISAALGLAEAARQLGREEKVAAFIGDGALTGGLAFEGLNNAGFSSADLLVILNDNNQSIDANLGGIHEYLLKITTNAHYNRLKNGIWRIMGDGRFRHFIQRWVRSLKSWIVKRTGGDLFEAMGIRYFGPVDGNDIEAVVKMYRKMKQMHGPRLLHFITVKGKGYAPAEADPVTWHAPGRFNPETGERISSPHTADRYQDVFGEVLCELAEKYPSVVGVTPAMATGCGMNKLAERHPGQFYDVGIEEEHAVTFSAGLAAGGLKPFCNIYSSFAQRAYDQIIHDVALQKLPVILCFDRAGLVGEDGATHTGAFDLAAFRSIPGTVVSAPKDEIELKNLMYSALEHTDGPYIIRYPRGMGEGVEWRSTAPEILECGKAEELLRGEEIAVVAAGPSVNRALEAAAEFPGKIGVYNFRFVKPLDTGMIRRISDTYKYILTVEDGTILGGLYGSVCEFVQEENLPLKVSGLGIPDTFVCQGKQSDQRAECGIDKAGIVGKIELLLRKV